MGAIGVRETWNAEHELDRFTFQSLAEIYNIKELFMNIDNFIN